MMGESELMEAFGRVEPDALKRWIDLGWVLPQQEGDGLYFDDSDVVRVRLICELHYELHIEEDSLSVVLLLMDQLYAARRSLREVLVAVDAQPAAVKARVAALIKSQRADMEQKPQQPDL